MTETARAQDSKQSAGGTKKAERSLPLHPLLFALFPVLSLYSVNVEELPLRAVLLPFGILLAASLLLWGLLTALLRDSLKAALLTTLLLCWFFLYGHLYDSLAPYLYWVVGLRIRHRWLLPCWTLLFAAAAVFLLRYRRSQSNLTRFLNVVTAVMAVLPLWNILLFQFGSRAGAQSLQFAHALTTDPLEGADSATPESTPASLPAGRVGETGPDIYYIILDAYANEQVLKDVYHYSNQPFLDSLAQKGFYVAHGSRSNYAMTLMSMSATLNMEYLNPLAEKVGKRSRDFRVFQEAIRNNRVARLLQERGYTYLNLNSPTDQALNDFPHVLLRTTVLCYQQDLGYYRSRTLAMLSALERLSKERAKDTAGSRRKPIFVYAHILCPHPPFVFGPNGEDAQDLSTQLASGGKEQLMRQYTDQITYLNRRLETIVEQFLARSQKPVLILQGDHGPAVRGDLATPGDALYRERMPILNAYYLPDSERFIRERTNRNSEAVSKVNLYNSITPVNSFRIVLNRYIGTNYALLPDRSYFSTYQYPYDFLDVTDKLGAATTAVNPDRRPEDLRSDKPEANLSRLNRLGR